MMRGLAAGLSALALMFGVAGESQAEWLFDGLGDLPGGEFHSESADVSADGSVVVGFSRSASSAAEGFRWTEATGMVGLSDLPGGTFSGGSPSGVSADGSVIVGTGTTELGSEAFRWTEATGMVGLGGLGVPSSPSHAHAVSADGLVIVGTTRHGPFRWTAATGIVSLDFDSGIPWDVSGDGSVIVGVSSRLGGVIWDAASGYRSFEEVLRDSGVNMDGWVLFAPWGISDDGRVIVGSGNNPNGDGEAWIARFVSEPSTITGRHVFYNNSAFDVPADGLTDDDAVAPDKRALLPGETATLENYTSYDKGINGIMVDIDGLPDGATPTVDDFQFRVGNDNDPNDWEDAANPTDITVRPGEGDDGADRITILWENNAIEKAWLQIIVKATDETGLDADGVFYFGNAIGESGNSATDAKVNAIDMLGARDNQRHFLDPAPIDFNFDFDRNKRVNATDMLIARNNTTHFLNALELITVPGPKLAAIPEPSALVLLGTAVVGLLGWGRWRRPA